MKTIMVAHEILVHPDKFQCGKRVTRKHSWIATEHMIPAMAMQISIHYA